MKRLLLLVAVLAAVAVSVAVLRPVPIVAESECDVVVGRLTQVGEGSSHDLVLWVDSDDRRFYINRGLERGLDLAMLRHDLIGEEVTLKYPRHWTPLDPFGSTVHVSVLIHGETVLFDETR